MIHRSMLSAALVLAMDAKNLLDVVDSVRIRFPEIDKFIKNNKTENEISVIDTEMTESNVPCPSSSSSPEVSSSYGLPNKISEHITAG